MKKWTGSKMSLLKKWAGSKINWLIKWAGSNINWQKNNKKQAEQLRSVAGKKGLKYNKIGECVKDENVIW